MTAQTTRAILLAMATLATHAGKRVIAVDTDGRLLLVDLTTAEIADGAEAGAVFKAAFLDFTLDIIRRTEATLKILPRRWVVERTFGMDDTPSASRSRS